VPHELSETELFHKILDTGLTFAFHCQHYRVQLGELELSVINVTEDLFILENGGFEV
jgi:hypothetical protein